MRFPIAAALALAILASALPVAAQDLPPIPVISVTPQTGRPGTVFFFTGWESQDPDGWITSFYWTFGDGDFTVGANVTHRYASPGPYTVSLTLSDNEGLNATGWAQLNVTGQNQLPLIESWSPLDHQVTMDPGALQSFSVTATGPDGDPLTYTWRVDGVVMQEVFGVSTSFYTYSPPSSGSHTVWVAVSDGLVDQNQTWEVDVKVAPPPASTSGPSFFPILAAGIVLVLVLIIGGVLLAHRPAAIRVFVPPAAPGAPWCHRCGATLEEAASCPVCGMPRFRG
ncbi:MAG TPA: PKD domain-containing protein [Thermoplasmata archaeon]|nr:PKD domain-containing protein [Thermoplasmata archaeon]